MKDNKVSVHCKNKYDKDFQVIHYFVKLTFIL